MNVDRLSWTLRTGCPEDLGAMLLIDADAGALFASAGLAIDLPATHPFVVAEQVRWRDALARGDVVVAIDAEQCALGFLVMGMVDGDPYLDQVSVVERAMRRGLGRALLGCAFHASASAGCLWLTTYAHLPWNGPFYASAGFRAVREPEGPELREVLRIQRSCLPAPDHRIAMVYRHRQ